MRWRRRTMTTCAAFWCWNRPHRQPLAGRRPFGPGFGPRHDPRASSPGRRRTAPFLEPGPTAGVMRLGPVFKVARCGASVCVWKPPLRRSNDCIGGAVCVWTQGRSFRCAGGVCRTARMDPFRAAHWQRAANGLLLNHVVCGVAADWVKSQPLFEQAAAMALGFRA